MGNTKDPKAGLFLLYTHPAFLGSRTNVIVRSRRPGVFAGLYLRIAFIGGTEKGGRRIPEEGTPSWYPLQTAAQQTEEAEKREVRRRSAANLLSDKESMPPNSRVL